MTSAAARAVYARAAKNIARCPLGLPILIFLSLCSCEPLLSTASLLLAGMDQGAPSALRQAEPPADAQTEQRQAGSRCRNFPNRALQ